MIRNERKVSYFAAISDPERRDQVDQLQQPDFAVTVGAHKVVVSYGVNTDSKTFGYYAFAHVERQRPDGKTIHEISSGTGIDVTEAMRAALPVDLGSQVISEHKKEQAQKKAQEKKQAAA